MMYLLIQSSINNANKASPTGSLVCYRMPRAARDFDAADSSATVCLFTEPVTL